MANIGSVKHLARAARFCLVTMLCAVVLTGCGGRGSWRKGRVPGSKPYTVRGKTYHPLKSAHGFVEEGTASWYGPGFHGKTTASGERYNQYAMTAAHKILPLGTKVRVTNLANRRAVLVEINDRGPFVEDRVIDLSRTAATRLEMMGKGTARVRVQSLDVIAQLREDGAMKGEFYVQVGAFADKENAWKLISILMQSGHKGRLQFGSNNLWNVQVGPWQNSASAQQMLGAFRTLYPHAFVVGGE
ncbi:septal ring lytic transglycosylase RlpA family protein [Candidatus Desulfovibrio trichonymphae]|uniref:Probable endolytic peptidoglycan transglycosylase RlpA n=1 Tax=Candidatus Desulfovibrio trichonymphae TaxID=1725232 RepID=A0A1J1DXX7_9BACT|nr:septal ring lytic transglycosylase RlpA family protein [Candidatus Desulfovibrio trichonymphae]BAV91950.1 rare lipoprotein A [Candidatus Desulfovibrio trichonymphae]